MPGKIITMRILWLSMLCCGLSHQARGAEEQLVGYWKFDEGQGEVTNDSSGHQNKGTIHGAQWVKGVSGSALRFDGVDDRLDLGAGLAASIKYANYTVEIWAKPSAPLTGGHYLMSFKHMRIGLSERQWIFWQGTPGWDAGYRAANNTAAPDQWHHVVGVYEIGKSIKLYVNGERGTQTQKGYGWPKMSGTTFVGTTSKANRRFFAGVIDEVKVYRRALSEAQIKQRYRNPGKDVETIDAPKTPTIQRSPVSPTLKKLKQQGLPYVRFGITADPHVQTSNKRERRLQAYVKEMGRWKADFIIDLGDFAIQIAEEKTTPKLHDGQLENLKRVWKLFSSGSCPAYLVMGNHDVGWIKGGDEVIAPEDLYKKNHYGEDITKQEYLAVTGLPHRYYSFDVNGYHFIVLDGNNDPAVMQDVPRGHDHGIQGGYCIDRKQLAWLAQDLAANRDKLKVVFSHEELHLTPPEGSGEGGDSPFLQKAGTLTSYIDNGWQVREMLTADGKVLACFFGHKHRSRWTVYGGVNYITLAAMFKDDGYVKVTIADKLYIEGFEGTGDGQRSYTLPIATRPSAQSAEGLSYPVHRMEHAPQLDGKVDGDTAWQSIARATGFHVLGGTRNVPKQSSFKMGFTDKALYVGVVCKEPEMAKLSDKAEDGGDHVYGDDGVEVFVYPTQSDKVLQVLANSAAARADYLNQAVGEWHDKAPKPFSRVGAFKGEDFYSVEIEIPFQKFGHCPREGEIWRGNVCRNMVIDGPLGPDRSSTWARLVRRNLEPDNFAQLVFHDSSPTGKEIVINSASADKDDADLHLIVDLSFDEGQGETAHGQSAIINDGKIIGARWSPRGAGYCLNFEKQGDRVEIPYSESLGEINKSVTLECWAYFGLDKLAGTRGTLISSTSSSGFSSGFYLDYVDQSTQTRSLCFGVAGGNSSRRNWVYAENVIKTTGWHHVMATYDPKLTDGWRTKIYVDGQRQVLRPRPRDKIVDPIVPSRLGVFIGAKPASRHAISEMTATFIGKIDHVRIWDTALTQADIDRLYGSSWAKSAPLSPEPSAVVADGKPHLTWSESGDGTGYILEVAELPDFPGKTVVKETLSEPNYQLPKSLSPGVYYWRVWSTNKAGKPTASCKPRAFVVPFELKFHAADTAPPAVTDVKPPRDTTTKTATPRISARWSDDRAIDIKSARLLLDGKDVTAKAAITAEGISFTPSAALTKGIHTIEIFASDTSGNPANRVRQHFAVGQPYRTVVEIDEHRRTTINGESFFPSIVYVTIANPASYPWYEKLARAGFNSFHYVMPVPAFEVTAKYKNCPVEEVYYWKELEMMKQAGLKLYGDIGNYFNMSIELLKKRYGSDELTPSAYEEATKLFTESCGWYDQHAEILAYKIDEPKGKFGRDRCNAMWKGLQAGGHKRPAFWILNSPGGAKVFGATADGIGIDCYPIPTRPLVQVAKYIDRTHEMLDYKKPVWFVPQAFDWRLMQPPYSPFTKRKKRDEVLANMPDDFVFTPNARQIRCMTYLALAHDVQGLLWWSTCWHYKVLSIVDFPREWEAFLELGGQVRYLSPMMLSTKYVDIGGDYQKQGIHLMAKSYEGKLYLIGVNPNEELPVAPEFRLPEGSYSRVDVLFENRSAKLTGNTFRDLFGPADVHVYRIDMDRESPR